MIRTVGMLAWPAIWVAFFLFGFRLQELVAANGATEVLGYDYATFVRQFADMGWIAYTGARHPGLGMVMSPVVLAGQLFLAKPILFKCFLLAVCSTIGTANVWLVRRLGGWLAAAVFVCFVFTWILAAVPESFPVAMLTLLLTLSHAAREGNGSVASRRAWLALFVLCSAVTVTNGLKVVAAYLAVNRLSKRQYAALILALIAVAAAGCGYFALRMARWNALHPEAPKTIVGALAQTAAWIPQGLGVAGRVKAAAVNFFAVPVLPWFCCADLGELASSARLVAGWGGSLWAVIVYLAAAAGGWMNRRSAIVRAGAAMFLVDVLIHIIFAWALDEGWIFCAHWFYILPIFIGLGLARCMERFARKFPEAERSR